MDRIYFGLTPAELRRLAFDFAEAHKIEYRFNKESKIAGEDWYQGFIKRHPSLTLRTPEKTSLVRASGLNEVVVNKSYDLLDNLMSAYNFSPSRIYNVDESVISTVPNHIAKIVSNKGKRQVGGLVSAERGETITCAFCCNAAGNFIPPLIIFPTKKINLELKDGCQVDTLAVFHPSAWMQTEIFSPTLFNDFYKFVNPTEDNPVLLLLDEHITHVKSLALIEAARQRNMHILCFPPHTLHKLQSLDISFMKSFKTYYSQECAMYLRNHPGQVTTTRKVGKIFGRACLRAAVPVNSTSGFEGPGIYPLNRLKFGDEDFASVTPTDIGNFCETSVEETTQNECNIETNKCSQNILPVTNDYLVDVTNIRALDDESVPGTSKAVTNKLNCDISVTTVVKSAKDTINNILPVPKIDCNIVRRSIKRKGSTAVIMRSRNVPTDMN